MELQQTVVELNFQNLFHSGKSLRSFKVSTVFHHGKYKKKIAHLDQDVQVVQNKVRFSLL